MPAVPLKKKSRPLRDATWRMARPTRETKTIYLSQSSEQAEQEKPSLQEIKSMLVDVQITVPSIALENKQLKKELADLKTKDKELSELKISVEKSSQVQRCIGEIIASDRDYHT